MCSGAFHIYRLREYLVCLPFAKEKREKPVYGGGACGKFYAIPGGPPQAVSK
jgi:hypothetical protein